MSETVTVSGIWTFAAQKQLELHTEDFLKHRTRVIVSLISSLGKYNCLQFDGEKCLTYGVLMDVLQETERGNRFVRQTSLDTRVQL